MENGDIITYTIELDNSKGTAPSTVTVKDEIPEGTTFVEGSVKVGGIATEDTAENLSNGVSVDLNAGETKTVEFKVKVNDIENGTEIKNIATVNNKYICRINNLFRKNINNRKWFELCS